ncbi:MAG TPA: tRNA (adenosine(37)-N6)-threonylcarbamoyltransferase complex ATPase subunit type 1 TsaE [Saprospiraceae bacterium]|nr:tRNA (adenosine(37)-N6)-threonylcarbamoyltransferase complex ATPase subunit type 1 TsaE [Saprospiraceae bacterium]
MEILIKEIEEIEAAVKELLSFSKEKKKFLFYGEIAAGKTTFIKQLCQHLGVRDNVTSPSFSLVNEYIYKDKKTGTEKLIHHIDLYRLNTLQEAIDIGIEDYLYDAHYCFIEWPELIKDLLPAGLIKISIEIFDDSSRKIIFL